MATLFPTIEGNPDYAVIINPRQHERLQALLDDARQGSARVQLVNPGAGHAADGSGSRQMPPALVFHRAPDSRLLNEEIFGPILPVLAYRSLDEAIAYVNALPRPLALYWFGTDSVARHEVLSRTVSGGVTVNDTLMHIAQPDLPFGGVGDSGRGAHHGVAQAADLTGGL